MKYVILFVITVHTAVCMSGTHPGANRSWDIKVHNINNVELSISNFGIIGQNNPYEPGCWWPKGSMHNYIFGAGIWFGALGGPYLSDTMVTIGYGPHGAETEVAPGLRGQDPNDPRVQIYLYPNSWPAPPDIFPMAPQDTLSHQDSWCCYNDCDIAYHIPGDTRPINIEVYQFGYAWDLPLLEDAVFLKFEVKNVDTCTIEQCYYGFVIDSDIGAEGWNEICYFQKGDWYILDSDSFWIDNLGYQWQEEEESIPPPSWFPGVIGIDYLQSPYDLQPGEDKDNDNIPDEYERDSVYYCLCVPPAQWDSDKDGVPGWRDASEIPQVGLTTFRWFTLNLEPNKDNERYITLAGYNFKTMVYCPFPETPPWPDDQRFLMGSGPFDLEPDSTATIMIAIMFADWYGYYDYPDTALVPIDYHLQHAYDMNWLLPGPPPPPVLDVLPGDARITLTWDDRSEITPDPFYELTSNPQGPFYDPNYREYDFEGYGIWKSMTGQKGDWQLLERKDLYNDIMFEDTTAPDSIRIVARNTGITHAYVDEDVRNGFEYYYGITAFDYNRLTDSMSCRELWMEGQMVVISAVPRRDPCNSIPGQAGVHQTAGNTRLKDDILLTPLSPLDMTDDLWFLEYAPVKPLHNDGQSALSTYRAYIYTADIVIIDSLVLVWDNTPLDAPHAFQMHNGVQTTVHLRRDSMPVDQSIFSRIQVIRGNYPESLLVGSRPGPWADYFAFWAYRGNDYEVQWISTHGGTVANSVTVFDVQAGDTIPFQPYNPEPDHVFDTLANGWCFLSHVGVSDTLVLNGSPPITNNTKYLYINGGLIGLKKGGFLQTGDILPATGDIWRVHADTLLAPAPVNACFEIQSTAGYIDSVTSRALSVKVVPNPLIVANEWSLTPRDPRVQFINLPADCTIRVFNLNGELVDVIVHHHDQGPVTEEQGGAAWWNVRNLREQEVASGIYVFHVQSAIGDQVGKFVIIR